MKTINHYAVVAILFLTSATACRKEISTDRSGSPAGGAASGRPTARRSDSTQHPNPGDTVKLTPPFPASQPASQNACNFAPIYGDTIIYPQPAVGGQDYIAHVVNSPGTGKYFSWPQGMVLDPNTGDINVTRSETGLRYAIGFVREGTTDTCLSELIIGGASYMDSIYVVQDGQKRALPYYDANPLLQSICAGNGCTFDVGNAARNQKVIIDQVTGIIDLEKTLNGTGLLGGAFGLLPVSGSVITTRIYYKLNDASNQALQHIDVQLQYFDSKALIGPGLLGNVVVRLNNLLSGHMISTAANPRPPLIIIVRRSN